MSTINIDEVMKDNTRSTDDRVKIAILFEQGVNNPDPGAQDAKQNMSDFQFDNGNWSDLTNDFNMIILAEKPGATELRPADVSAFTTVQDCIDAVNNAVK